MAPYGPYGPDPTGSRRFLREFPTLSRPSCGKWIWSHFPTLIGSGRELGREMRVGNDTLHIPNIYQISTKSSTMKDLEEYIRMLISVPRSVLCDYSSQSMIGYTFSSWLVSTQPRIEYIYLIHLCLLYLFTYLTQLQYKVPAGVVILGHLGRLVRVTESDGIHCGYR